jgi:hypothetical protein
MRDTHHVLVKPKKLYAVMLYIIELHILKIRGNVSAIFDDVKVSHLYEIR